MRGKNFKNMSKRKHKKRIQEQSATVIKPDVKVNVEIDYDKLAEAILKAEKKAEETQDKKLTSVLWLQRNGLEILYKTLAVTGVLLSLLLAISFVVAVSKLEWTSISHVFGNLLAMLIFVLVFFVGFVISGMIWTASKEIQDVKDKQLIMSMSSGLIGFLALIAAIVAIFVK